jgi:hypothetical protein
MPRFNTESNEYRVTFNELNVQSVPDILKTPQNLFDSDVTNEIVLSSKTLLAYSAGKGIQVFV